ncbi:MAG: ammonium transporter [Pseudomonadota bacterium]|nr:ammonium transporter [Pseudomonadota bacterium]
MIDSGDTAWILTSTALVLFMTLPGLALFYGGLVQSRNVLSVLMHCIAIACLASVMWLVGVYSLAFGEGNAYIGGMGKALLSGVARDAVWPGTKIPETVFFMFQMTFAIITPALIVGAFVERIKFSAVLLFSALWLVVVYAPVAHWVWGGGWLATMGVMDFAGGLVVHLTAGVSAVVLVLALGPRRGFPGEVKPPHAPWMTMVGASMLWVGWFGFNAGSALASGGGAGMAMTVTHISAATASLVWLLIEWTKFGRPSLVGLVTGTIAGLATITPASGYVGPGAALVFGLAGGVICYLCVDLVKKRFKIDDSLVVFAVHGVGGATGVLLTAIFADASLGGSGLAEGVSQGAQFVTQLTGAGATLIWSAGATFVIVLLVKAATGLRVNKDAELEGLDISSHGESGYTL